MMTDPIVSLLEWFNDQPKEIRQDLAFCVVPATPGLDPQRTVFNGTEPDVRLNDWLKEQGDDGSLMRRVGAVVAIRAAIQFFVIDRRDTKQGWQETKSRMQWLIAKTKQDGHDAEQFERQYEQLELRGQRWLRTCESWQQLCAGPLSDDALNALLETIGQS